MPSLHWILALTLTLLHYLNGASISQPEDPRVDSLLSNIEELNEVDCVRVPTNDSVFYSPLNSQEGCITDALKCASEELKVVAEECFRQHENLENYYQLCRQTSDFIKSILTDRPQQSKTCHQCESNSQKPYKKFIEELDTLIRMSASERWRS